MPLEFGGLMQGPLGGSSDRFERMGDRYSAMVTTPAMLIEPDGRRWAARLMRARREGGIVRLHQPGLRIGAPGTPVVASNTSTGRTIPLEGLTPEYPIREGQWFNYFYEGQRYLDQAAEQVIANSDGEAEITLQSLIRRPLLAGASIEIADPCIEGWIEGDFSIARSVERITSFSFTISEKD